MSSFGAYSHSEVADAADRFISKMDERQLTATIQSQQAQMSHDARVALVQSVLDAFRHRGESSDDVAEAAGVPAERLLLADADGVATLLAYVARNTGLLKEALTTMIESRPAFAAQLPRSIVEGISSKLAQA